MYRKNTFTWLITKFNSAVTNRYKTNLVQCLYERAYKICSLVSSLKLELGYIKKFFYKNGHPNKLVSFVMRNKEHKAVNPAEPIMTASKKPVYSSIPFISHRTNSAIKKELRRITTKYYPQIDLKLVFSNYFSVKSFSASKIKSLVISRVM